MVLSTIQLLLPIYFCLGQTAVAEHAAVSVYNLVFSIKHLDERFEGSRSNLAV